MNSEWLNVRSILEKRQLTEIMTENNNLLRTITVLLSVVDCKLVKVYQMHGLSKRAGAEMSSPNPELLFYVEYSGSQQSSLLAWIATRLPCPATMDCSGLCCKSSHKTYNFDSLSSPALFPLKCLPTIPVYKILWINITYEQASYVFTQLHFP